MTFILSLIVKEFWPIRFCNIASVQFWGLLVFICAKFSQGPTTAFNLEWGLDFVLATIIFCFLFFVFRLAAVLLIIILLHDPVSAKLTQRLQGVQVWRGKKAVKQIQIITQPCLSVWHVVLISRVRRKLFQQSCGLISCNLLLCCKTFFFFFTEKKL